MSKLEEMIVELCPDGVEYKSLKNILTIKNGSDYKGFPEGDIPVYGSGGIIAYTSKSVFDKPSVLIPRKGSIDKLYYVDTPFWNVDTIFYTDINTDVAIPRYVYHCLMKEHLEKLNTAGGVPSLTQAVLNKVIIPVPPLELQREIVRILDSLAEHTEELVSELTEELSVRKQQYEYYRDELLDSDFIKGVSRVKLKDIATNIFRGSGIKREDISEEGIPCVRYGEIYTTYNTYFDECVSHTKLEYISTPKWFDHGDILFAITGENVEDIAKSVAYIGDQKCLAGGDIVVMKHHQNPKYLAYALSTMDARRQKGKGKIKSKVVHSNVPSIEEIEIPLPTKGMQDRIVQILDNFDSFYNNLSSGLTKEIEARQKEYKYYRDKLLTFKEKTA